MNTLTPVNHGRTVSIRVTGMSVNVLIVILEIPAVREPTRKITYLIVYIMSYQEIYVYVIMCSYLKGTQLSIIPSHRATSGI